MRLAVVIQLWILESPLAAVQTEPEWKEEKILMRKSTAHTSEEQK